MRRWRWKFCQFNTCSSKAFASFDYAQEENKKFIKDSVKNMRLKNIAPLNFLIFWLYYITINCFSDATAGKGLKPQTDWPLGCFCRAPYKEDLNHEKKSGTFSQIWPAGTFPIFANRSVNRDTLNRLYVYRSHIFLKW